MQNAVLEKTIHSKIVEKGRPTQKELKTSTMNLAVSDGGRHLGHQRMETRIRQTR